MRDLIVVVLVCAAACGSPAAPSGGAQEPGAAAPADPETDELVHTWIVAEHVLAKGASLTDGDARGFHGRTIDITATGYTSPWQGTCEDAARVKRARELKGVMLELGLQIPDRDRIDTFGLGPKLTEYRMTCNERRNPAPLVLYVGDEKAMTCFGGACYLLNKF